MKEIKARDYQKECLAKITEAVEMGSKRALVVMASGLGKTLTSAFAIEEYFKGREFGRVLILCHSEAILIQSKEKYKGYFGEEYSYGMFTGNERVTRQTDFFFATFQTLKEHRKEFNKATFSYIVVDEAHHSHARTYFPTIKYFEPEFLLGLTATPDRLDGQDIKEIYGAPVYELNFIEAMNRGLLAECDYQLVLDDISQEKLDECLESGEKISITQLNRTVFVPKRDEEIVRLIRQYSAEQQDPKTIIFCKTIEHARCITKMMGEDTVLVHTSQSNLVNDMALEAFRQGKIHTIVSVQMLNEGIDVPDANVIVFLRNTVSETIFYQQLGRGTRLSPGKDKVKVLDFVANCERIQAVLELKQEIDNFKTHKPIEEAYEHGTGDADSREKFMLNIATPEFKREEVNLIELLSLPSQWFRKTDDELLEIYFKASLHAGKWLTMAELDADSTLPDYAIYRRRLNGLEEMRELLRATYDADEIYKLDSTLKASDRPTSCLIRLYYEESIKAGHWLTGKEINNNHRMPSKSIYVSRLNGHMQAQKEAIQLYGDPFTGSKHKMTAKEVSLLSNEQLLDLYFKESQKVGRWLSDGEIAKHPTLPSSETFRTRFNGMKNMRSAAIEKFGDSFDFIDVTIIDLNDSQLIRLYYEESLKVGRWIKMIEFRDNAKLPSYGTYKKRFGSIECLRSEAEKMFGPIQNNNN